MFDRISESDWKIFKPVRKLALERFCERVLIEAERIRADVSKSQHERYVETLRSSSKYSTICAGRPQ
jgi:hypothetical protein